MRGSNQYKKSSTQLPLIELKSDFALKAVLNEHTTSEELLDLDNIIDNTITIRWHILEHSNCPPALFNRYSDSSDSMLRYRIVNNPACPVDILRKIYDASDRTNLETKSILLHLSTNPICPPDILKQLAPLYPTYIASNPNSTLDTLRKLARDPDRQIRENVASNPACSADILDTLLENPSTIILQRILRHPNAPLRMKALHALET